jgi:hypothetical protein
MTITRQDLWRMIEGEREAFMAEITRRTMSGEMTVSEAVEIEGVLEDFAEHVRRTFKVNPKLKAAGARPRRRRL